MHVRFLIPILVALGLSACAPGQQEADYSGGAGERDSSSGMGY